MKQEIKQSLEDRNLDIIEYFMKTGKSYYDIAKDFNISTEIVRAVLTGLKFKPEPKTVKFEHSWANEEHEMIEITVKTSLISGKVVHLIPSRINFES